MKRLLVPSLFVLASACSLQGAPLGTAFSYQGRLAENGTPAGGLYQLRFAVYDAAVSGNAIGNPLTNTVSVSNGLFNVILDFGAGVFTGDARWLQIGVRTNGATGNFTALAPRQPVTPSPYALFATQAENATTAGTATAVSANAVSGTSLQANSVTSAKITDGTILAADLSATLAGSTFWRLDGNTGTDPNTQFLGTSDNRALEFRVNRQPFLRAEPTLNTPDLLAGSVFNYLLNDADGVTIAGGGQADEPNIAGGWFSFIGAGKSNVIHAAGIGSGIVSGRQNEIYTNVWGGLIGGGDANFIDSYSDFAVIGGGANNLIAYNTPKAGILGGEFNLIGEGATAAVVAGGADNWVQTNAMYATIPGGAQAAAINYGQLAYASGMFGYWGDAQSSLFVLRYTTTNAVTRELFLDGAVERLKVPVDSVTMFQCMIVARSLSTGGSACFRAEGCIKDVAGTVSLVGTPTVTQVASDLAGLALPSIQANVASGALVIRATGLAGHRIRWVARVQTVEVTL